MVARILSTSLAAAVLLGAAVAQADAEHPTPESAHTPPDFGLYVSPAFTEPLGEMGDGTGAGVGGLLGFSYRLLDDWQFVGRTGYIAGSDKDVALPVASMRASVSYAPLLGGLKAYVFGEPAAPVHVYVRGELGPLLVINAVNVAADGLSASASHSSLHFGMAVSAGFETFDMVDVGVGLLVADADHVDQSTALLMTVGCRLPSF